LPEARDVPAAFKSRRGMPFELFLGFRRAAAREEAAQRVEKRTEETRRTAGKLRIFREMQILDDRARHILGF
jgi:hypothetical protein